MDNLHNIPPFDEAIEEAALGALLIDSKSIKLVGDILDPELFYKEDNKRVCEAICALLDESKEIDILTTTLKMRQLKTLEQAGGAYYISTLTNRVGSGGHIETHIKILKELMLKRNLASETMEIYRNTFSENFSAKELIDQSEKKITALTSQIISFKSTSSADLYKESIERNKALRTSKNSLIGIPSGFVDIDNITGGWQKSDLVIVAARPGMGKTSLALEFLKNPAFKNIPTAFFSLEMSNPQLYSRLQSQTSGISLEKILRIGLNDGEVDHMNESCKILKDAPLYFDDSGGMTIFDIKNKARKLKREKDIKLLVVDYLQLISGKRGHSRENEVSDISKSLKTLAKELDIPIICLSQLSRSVEQRGGAKIPVLSDLRDSGSIEQDADIVCFIYRPEYYGIMEDDNGNSTEGKASLMIAKHRNGQTRNVTLEFKKENTKFSDLYHGEDNPF